MIYDWKAGMKDKNKIQKRKNYAILQNTAGFILGALFTILILTFFPKLGQSLPQEPNYSRIITTNTSENLGVGLEYYLCEVTNFYEAHITILSIIIGLILTVGFIYIYQVSKNYVDDMVTEALDRKPFQTTLNILVSRIVNKVTEKRIKELSTENNIPELLQMQEELNDLLEIREDLKKMVEQCVVERIVFLEKTNTDASYAPRKETSQKLSNQVELK